MATLTLSRQALALISEMLDINDDDETLADETGADVDTVAELREVVRNAL